MTDAMEPSKISSAREKTEYRIVSLHASADSEYVVIRVRAQRASQVSENCRQHDEITRKNETKTYILRVEEYAALHEKFCVNDFLSDQQTERLDAAAQASRAYNRGLNILGYGANSSRMLQKKLTEKGFSPDVAQRTADVLASRGYLKEERDAWRVAQQCLRRGRGLRRVLQELRAKGYGEEALSAVREQLSDYDFTSLCTAVAKKKCPFFPAERAEREKLTAYLLRCGFDSTQIREAFRRMAATES